MLFIKLGFNEADTFKSISILIYLVSKQSIYTQGKGLMPWLIKMVDERILYIGVCKGSMNKIFHWFLKLPILIVMPHSDFWASLC